MVSRLQLSETLHKILGNDNVYFQPPESIEMNYPAIVYSLDDIRNSFANNSVYIQNRAYQITVIDKDPDSEIVDRISAISKCKFVRSFASDNLNHWVFILHI